MMWGPYFNDRPAYYACWIDFCLKYNPHMKFYATIYARSPELIDGDIPFGGSSDFPSRELDRLFRKIAWQAVVRNPLSGVTDEDRNGVRAHRIEQLLTPLAEHGGSLSHQPFSGLC